MPSIGRPSITEKNSAARKKLAFTLWRIQQKDPSFKLTAYMKEKLSEEGYLIVEPGGHQSLGPGRRRDEVALTPKAIGLVNIAKGWNIEAMAS